MKTGGWKLMAGWVPALIWMTIIFVGSTDLMSAPHTSRFLVPFLRWLAPEMGVETIALVQFGLRKLAHVAEYTILALLLWRGVRLSLRLSPRRGALLVGLIGVVYAAADEWHQSFVVSRTGAVQDVLIDTIGVALGVTAGWFWTARKRKSAG